jgi:hypothetical protein
MDGRSSLVDFESGLAGDETYYSIPPAGVLSTWVLLVRVDLVEDRLIAGPAQLGAA